MSMWMMGIKVCERQREGYSEVDDTYRERERERRVKRETEIGDVERPGAKTRNVFRACLGAQLTICAQK